MYSTSTCDASCTDCSPLCSSTEPHLPVTVIPYESFDKLSPAHGDDAGTSSASSTCTQAGDDIEEKDGMEKKKKKKRSKNSEKKTNVVEQVFGRIGEMLQSVGNEIWRGSVMQVESGMISTSVRPM